MGTAFPVGVCVALSPGFNSIASNPLCFTNSTLPVVFQCSGVSAILMGSAPQALIDKKQSPIRLLFFLITASIFAGRGFGDGNVATRTWMMQNGFGRCAWAKLTKPVD